MTLNAKLDRDGFVLAPGVISQSEATRLIEALENGSTASEISRHDPGRYAIRNLLDLVPQVRRLADSVPCRRIVEAVLGTRLGGVRGLFFDKTRDANWKVAWHQDLTIAVKERLDAPGFGPWSMKAGVPHVQPPASVLEGMLTLRLHLDDCDENNGALQVLPGSHRHGKLRADGIRDWRTRVPAFPCAAKRGDVLLMRPLLLHRSLPALYPTHRRVIHLEFAAGSMPGGLHWRE